MATTARATPAPVAASIAKRNSSPPPNTEIMVVSRKKSCTSDLEAQTARVVARAQLSRRRRYQRGKRIRREQIRNVCERRAVAVEQKAPGKEHGARDYEQG